MLFHYKPVVNKEKEKKPNKNPKLNTSRKNILKG